MYHTKQRYGSVLAYVLVAAMLLSALILPADAATSGQIRDQIENLEAQAENIQAQQNALAAQIAESEGETTDLLQQKFNLDQQIELTQQEISNQQAQIQEYNNLIAAKQSELDDALTQEAALYDQYKTRIRAMEENGRISYWAVLFSSSSFSDLLDSINMISEVAASDQIMLDRLEAIADEVAAARMELEEEKVELQAAQQGLEQTEAELASQREAADALIQELLANQAYLDESASYYAQLEDELIAQIAQLEDDYDEAVAAENAAARPNGGGASGGWHSPLSYLYVTSAYGNRYDPLNGTYTFHSGVDLAASIGQPIFSVKSGTVTTASYSSVFGYYVVINHGDGFSTLYGHMTNYCVSLGQPVSGGQTIGYAGNTGRSTGPHLHLTMYYNGATVNPMAYIG